MNSVIAQNGTLVDLFSTILNPSSYANMLFQRVINSSNYSVGQVHFYASYNVANALATSRPIFNQDTSFSHYERYVIYNPNFMRNMEFWSSNEFVPLAIFAHELGHHFYGHTDNPHKITMNSWDKEGEADYYSGFVLARLGAKPSDLELSHRLMFTMWANETHPDSCKRISSIAKGWKDGGGIGLVEANLKLVYEKFNNELNRWLE